MVIVKLVKYRMEILRSILVLCICVATSSDPAILNTGADNHYQHYPKAGGWLKVHRRPSTWRDARRTCDLEGGEIASPINKQIKRAIMESMIKNNVTTMAFTGVHATFAKGYFFSISGVALKDMSITWALDEPDNHNNNEECLAISRAGKMADVDCSIVLPFLCYRTTSGDELGECGDISLGYELNMKTQSCYKFHIKKVEWRDALLACSSEHGHLAIINSMNEAIVLRELYSQNPNMTNDVAYSHIGFYNMGQNSTEFRTIHGQTLIEAGSDNFCKGEPNNLNTEMCGSIKSMGCLNDINCSKKLTFICERQPNI